jgi:FixJ family two-component response regulator
MTTRRFVSHLETCSVPWIIKSRSADLPQSSSMSNCRTRPHVWVLDVRMPGTSGLELQEYLTRVNIRLPVILVTGFGDVPMSVKAMKAGAVDFLTKPIRDQDLLDAVGAAIRLDQGRRREVAQVAQLRERYARLTPRERQVIALVASGLLNKQVANELSIGEVTVKMHRGSAMRKLGAKSVATLARIAEVLDIQG